ncbi:hypothetical protein MHH56_12085 [Paenibacillus sp. FSL K6-3182]|uniref:hypothetical protein n=1 Tax=unclassified Paenibacillus TaxID=185978 RepID=UPI0030CBEA40
MSKHVVLFTILGLFSIWGCVYVGSLAPSLWKQKNFRGAIGVSILAGITLVVPVLVRMIGEE